MNICNATDLQNGNIAVRKGRALLGESLTHHSVLTRSVAAPIVMLGGIFKLNNLAPRMYFGSPRTESRVNSILALRFSQSFARFCMLYITDSRKHTW